MNSTFKVVFNKARGALMVVNEVTSSVQAKGTKTVVAAAVAALISGTAMAGEWIAAPEDLKAATDTAITDANWSEIKDQNAFTLTATDSKATKPWASISKNQTFDKTLWVSGVGAKAHASGFGVSGEDVTFTNKGTIYATSGKDGVNYQNDAIWAGKGATAVNDGKIVAKDAYGMRVGTGDKASKIINNGSIYVESTGAGMELGGAANSEAVNTGLISVGDVNTESAQGLKFGHGVLIQDQTGAKFTNEGTITAGKGASAIEIKKNEAETTAKVVLKGNSKVDGLIHVGTGVTSAVIVAEEGVTDTLTLKAENAASQDIQGTKLKVLTNSTITLADEQASKLAKVVVDETSRLNLSIFQADNAVTEANISGILNVTHLNSKSEGATENDQLLLAYGSTWNLNGGKLYAEGSEFTGTLRIGSAGSKQSGTLNVSEGSALNLTRLEVKKLGTVTVNADSSITAQTLDISKGNVNVNGGSLTVTGSKGFTVFTGTDNSTPALTLNNGTFTVDAASLFQEKATEKDATTTYEATDAAKAIKGTGSVNVTSDAFEYTLAQLSGAQKLLNSEGSADIKLVFANGTLKLAEGETLEAGHVSGLLLADQTGVSGTEANAAFAVDKTTTLGALNFAAVTDKNAESIALGNTAALTLVGNGGDVFKNLGAKVTKVEAGDLVLGTADSTGNVNVETLKAANLTVEGDFTAQAIEATTATINGALQADAINATNGTVAGVLALTGNVAEDAAEITGTISVTDMGVLTTNLKAAQAYAANYADEELSVLYVDRQLKLADGAVINVGTDQTREGGAAAPAADTTFNLKANSIAGIDAASFLYTGDPTEDADVSVFGNDATVNFTGGEIEIVNVNKLGKIDLGGSVTDTSNNEKPNIDTDSIYVLVDNVDKQTGVVTLGYNEGLVSDKTVDDRLAGLFAKGASDKEMAILTALDTEAFFDEANDKLTAAGEKAFEQATGGNATAGVLNVAYDANAQVTDAIVRHQLSEHAGMGVWADVFYAKNEAKELYGDFGYSADIYGGVLGFDYTAACGGTLGAALTVGTADADSEGGVLSNSLSSDFVGLSVYASKDFSGLNVKADLGYIDFSNDFSGLGDASDASTITFGVRGDFTAYQNGAFSIAPHFGLRYTRIDTDAVAFNDEQNMNVFEAPIGVKFAGTFEATGWKVVPSYDFTIVPQLGDKDVEAFGTAGDITILSGGLFNNVLGVEAVKGNMSFGLNASYGFGPDDRANTQVNANFSYRF